MILTSRIIQKKKRWLARALELPDETRLAKALSPRWWFASAMRWRNDPAGGFL
jgi:hypothetical protein